jgi:hypothetical protein
LIYLTAFLGATRIEVRKGFGTPFAEKDTVQSPHVESSRVCPEVSLLEYSVAEDVSEVASRDPFAVSEL